MGIYASTNLGSIREGVVVVVDDDDDETWMGGVSAISQNCEDDWCDDGIKDGEVLELASAFEGLGGTKSACSKVSSSRTVIKGQGLKNSVIYTNEKFILD